MKSIPAATPITLTKEETLSLKAWPVRRRRNTGCDSGRGLCCFRRRAWRRAQSAERSASKWRVRYAERRRPGLDETGDRGNEPKYTDATDQRLLAVLDRPIPAGYARWNGPLIAKALGDVDMQYAWRFLRTHKIDLAGRKSWCESNDPDFGQVWTEGGHRRGSVGRADGSE
jgi:hypothetical protein